MDAVKSFWGIIQGDPKFMRHVNGWLTMFWVAMIPIAYFSGWLESVTFVSALSLWALVSGHWSAWQAARTEVKQEKEEKKDTEGKLVKRILKDTTIQKSKTHRKK